MVAGTQKVNPSTGPGSHSLGLAYKTVIITGITDDGRVTCKDNYGKEVMVNASVQRAKGIRPQVGERWFIDREFGGWTLAACLSVPPPPVVTGLSETMDPASLSLLRALASLGLVDDQTYDIDHVPYDIHPTTITRTGSGSVKTMHLVLVWTPPVFGTPDSYNVEVDYFDQWGSGPFSGTFVQSNVTSPQTFDKPIADGITTLRVTVTAVEGTQTFTSAPVTIAVPV